MEFNSIKIKDTNIELIDGDRGKNYPKNNEMMDSGHTLFLNNKNIAKNFLDDSFGNFITEDKSDSLRKGKLCRNDIVLSTRGSVGNVGFYHSKIQMNHIRINSGMIILRNNDKKFLDEYLYIFLRSPYMQNKFKEFISGSVQNHLPIRDLQQIEIMYPPIYYQSYIIKIIMNIEEKIKINNEIIANLEELSQTLFKRWFVDFEFPDENGNPYKSSGGDMVESELGVIPKDWSIQTLNDISESYNTKRKPLSKLEREKVASIYPYYGATKIIDYVDDYLFDGKFILVGEDGTVQTEEGHPFVQYVWGQFWVSNHAHILKGKNLSDEVLMLILNNIDIQPYITGAVQPKISKKNLNSIKIVVGSKLIYGKFDQYINTYYKKIREVHDENKYLTQLRDTLLPKLMSGEIEIPDYIEVNEDELSI